MPSHSTNHLEKRSKTSIERKMQFLFFGIAIVPVSILVGSAAAGMYKNEAIAASVVIQVIGLIAAYFVVSRIVRQVATINKTLANISTGDFEARADIVSSDELGEAAIALNAMCDNTLNLIQSNDERDKIQNSIENLIAEMEEIAAGDLTITSDVSGDMTGAIATSVNHMTAQLRSIVRQVQSAAAHVTTSAGRIRNASTTMSKETDCQASRISDASEQLLEMTESFQNVAAMTKESVEVAIEARQTASNGLNAVSDTVEGMQRIRDQVQSTSKRIKRFGESSQEIGEIVQLISDIADRTSILALNASIQASMAGSAGQGFAVVAEEIESLADRSTDATKQISKLIRAIQNETSEVISDMEESTREVVAGSQLAAQAGETLFEIDSVSNQLVELIQTSSTSALQQAETATRVAESMTEICQSTKESADKNRESSQSVGRLAAMVNQLRDSVSQFTVANEDRFDSECETMSDDDFAYPEASTMSVEAAVEPRAELQIEAEAEQMEKEPAAEAILDARFRRATESRDKMEEEGVSAKKPEKPARQTTRTSTQQGKKSRDRVSRTIMMDDDCAATDTDPGQTDVEIDAQLLRQVQDARALLKKTNVANDGDNTADSHKNKNTIEQDDRTDKKTFMMDE